MKFGVLVFPGSNCDQDTYHVIAEMARQPVTCLWHDSPDLQGCDAILVVAGLVTQEVPYNEVYQRCVDAMKQLAPVAAKAKVRIGCENC